MSVEILGKPPVDSEIIRTHKLSKGLVFCAPFNEEPGTHYCKDYVSGARIIPYQGGSNAGVSLSGRNAIRRERIYSNSGFAQYLGGEGDWAVVSDYSCPIDFFITDKPALYDIPLAYMVTHLIQPRNSTSGLTRLFDAIYGPTFNGYVNHIAGKYTTSYKNQSNTVVNVDLPFSVGDSIFTNFIFAENNGQVYTNGVLQTTIANLSVHNTFFDNNYGSSYLLKEASLGWSVSTAGPASARATPFQGLYSAAWLHYFYNVNDIPTQADITSWINYGLWQNFTRSSKRDSCRKVYLFVRPIINISITSTLQNANTQTIAGVVSESLFINSSLQNSNAQTQTSALSIGSNLLESLPNSVVSAGSISISSGTSLIITDTLPSGIASTETSILSIGSSLVSTIPNSQASTNSSLISFVINSTLPNSQAATLQSAIFAGNTINSSVAVAFAGTYISEVGTQGTLIELLDILNNIVNLAKSGVNDIQTINVQTPNLTGFTGTRV